MTMTAKRAGLLLALMLLLAAHAPAEQAAEYMDLTLYFRYAETGFIGTERARIDLRREETLATLIVERLIEGPQIGHERLQGIFPQETKLISATSDGMTAYITLSSDFLGKPNGAPSDWDARESWRREAALRRTLAFQSIVLALTDEGRCQRVQLYIADDDNEVPQRVALTWFDPDEKDTELRLAACGRDESILLTPGVALDQILGAWKRQDWATLYAFVAQMNEDAPTSYAAFWREMDDLGMAMVDYRISGGAVSLDGQSATLVLDATISSPDGEQAEIVRETVPMIREEDNWTISMTKLRQLLVRD